MSTMCAVLLWLFWRRVSSELVAVTWVVAAVFSAMIGLLQYFGEAHVWYPWISQTGPGEAFANLRQRNQFATLTSIGLVALMALLARQASAQRIPWLAGLAMIMLALGNAASGSRTGLLQWVLIAMLNFLWFFSHQRRLLVFSLQALLVYGAAVIALPWLLEVVTKVHSGGLFGRLVESNGCSSRRLLWSNVLTLIAKKPWLGWGWDELDYAHFITLYPGERFCEILDNAHNLPLHLAVELGVPVALLICGGLAWLVLRAKPWRDTAPMRQMAWGVLAVIGLHSLLEYPLWYGPFEIAAGLCLGLLLRYKGECAVYSPDGRELRHALPASPYLRLLVSAITGGALVGTAISYHQVSQIYLPPAERSPAYHDDTLNKVRGNWLFRFQARFAELSLTDLTASNAASVYAMSSELLHYSPEPRVIEQLIESATMLGHDDEALYYLIRYKAAFPTEHARWANTLHLVINMTNDKLEPSSKAGSLAEKLH